MKKLLMLWLLFASLSFADTQIYVKTDASANGRPTQYTVAGSGTTVASTTSISGDCTMSTAGVITCSKVNGNTVGAGSGTIVTTAAMSGDCTETTGGAITCTKSSGNTFAPGTDPTTNALGQGSAWLTSIYSNASTSFTNSNLVLNLAAATTYRVVFVGSGSNNTNASGAAFTFVLSDSTGCTMRFVWMGQTTAAAALTSGTVTSSGGASPTFWANATGGIRAWVREEGVIGGCTNATTIRLQGEAVTAGTLTVDSFSQLKVEKLGGGL